MGVSFARIFFLRLLCTVTVRAAARLCQGDRQPQSRFPESGPSLCSCRSEKRSRELSELVLIRVLRTALQEEKKLLLSVARHISHRICNAQPTIQPPGFRRTYVELPAKARCRYPRQSRPHGEVDYLPTYLPRYLSHLPVDKQVQTCLGSRYLARELQETKPPSCWFTFSSFTKFS